MNEPDLLADKEAVKHATRFMDRIQKKYQQENPCPECGSHNVQIDIDFISGVDMQGREWCNDCGWKKITSTVKQPEEKK